MRVWNDRTRWLIRTAEIAAAAGAAAALAFALLNIERIGGPNDRPTPRDTAATAATRHQGTAGTGTNSPAEGTSATDQVSRSEASDKTVEPRAEPVGENQWN